MKKKSQNLEEIKRKFSEYRRRNPGKSNNFPKELKTLVKNAVDNGHRISDVAKSAQVTHVSVRVWAGLQTFSQGSHPSKPQKLKVIPAQEQRNDRTEESARIRLISGVEVHLSTGALSKQLLQTLSELGE